MIPATKLAVLVLVCCLLAGCAVKKPVTVVPVTIAWYPHWQCSTANSNDCDLVYGYNPPQYSAPACWGHRVLFLWQRTEPQSCVKSKVSRDASRQLR